MRTLAAFTNLLYPPACARCHHRLPIDSAVFCLTCEEAMPRCTWPLCVRCGVGLTQTPKDLSLTCASCRRRPPAFEAARAPWRYEGPVRDAVQQFKYHRRWRIGTWLAHQMAAVASTEFPVGQLDAVLPVPLHWLKDRLRDFNPAAQLARRVAEPLGLPCHLTTLRRRRWTTTQTALTWSTRWRNVEEAFVADVECAQDRTFLLIDDVLTSGATAHACTLALKAAGAQRVFVLTAARTPPP